MKNLVILLAIVMAAGSVGCERKIPEEPRTYDSETEPPPSALIVRNDPRVAEDQTVVSDEAKERPARPAADEEPGTEGGDEGEPATQPGDETEPATQPGDETEPATQPAGGGEPATQPDDDGGDEPAP